MHTAFITAANFQGNNVFTLQKEVLHTVSVENGNSRAGLLEFFAAAYILQRPIHSVYPLCGADEYISHCNRIIRPPKCAHEEKIHIMWTNSSGSSASPWVPDHCVPIVLRRHCTLPLAIKRNSHYLITFGKKTYVCRVCDLDVILNLVAVQFMASFSEG